MIYKEGFKACGKYEIKTPSCPYCGEKLTNVVSLFLSEVGAKYTFYWTCNCKDVLTVEEAINKRINALKNNKS